MHSFHFDDQYNSFHNKGYGAAPETDNIVGAGSPNGTALVLGWRAIKPCTQLLKSP